MEARNFLLADNLSLMSDDRTYLAFYGCTRRIQHILAAMMLSHSHEVQDLLTNKTEYDKK